MPTLTAAAVLIGRRQRHFRDRDHTGTLADADIELIEAIGRYPAGTTIAVVITDLAARVQAKEGRGFGDFTANAFVKAIQVASFSARASVVGTTRTGSRNTHAVFKKIQSGSFTANAKIV